VAICLVGSLGLGRAATKDSGDATAWPEITQAEKSLTKVPEDPEADAVVLLKTRDGRILRKADDLVNVLQHHWRLKVLTERGKQYGAVRIRATKGSRVDAIEARTIKPDGTIVPVAPDQIFDKVVLRVGSYTIVDKVFNFPAVEQGAILEYRYQRHDNGLFFLDPYFFAGEEITLRSRVSQGFLGGSSYSIVCDLCPAVQPVIGEWRDGKQKGQLYTMELKNVPGYRDEILMPPERETTPRLEMVLNLWKGQAFWALGRQDRFFIDWASVAGYVSYGYDKTIKEGQSAIKPVVDGWVQGAASPQEKAAAVVRHVRNDFRYIPYTSVVGASRSIGAILKDKTADNEEKAVLLLAALKTLGIEGQAVLVSGKDSGSVNPKFFSLSQFTHTVVALPKPDGGADYVDPTVSYAPYAFMPWRDSGANALLVKGGQGELIDLPTKTELSTTRYRVTLKPKTDGKAEADVVVELNGEDAMDVREDLVPASETARSDWLKEWLDDRRPGAVLSAQAIENLEDFEKPLLLKLTFQSPGLVTVADDVFAVRGCVLTCLGVNPLSRASRTHPFYVDRGWNVEESVVILPPKEGLEAASMPPIAVAKSAIGNLSLSCSPQGEGGVRCLRQFSARRNRWPATENASVRAMYDKIVQADRTTVAFAAAAGGG
jgi:hypothetical protein